MKWGVIGYGEITPSFIEGLNASKDSLLTGIATTSSYKSLKGNKLYGGVALYNNYYELVNNSEIEIVYVSTTNNLHYKNAKLVIESGKHLLCEKPLTPSIGQTKELIEMSKKNNVFLMEGMWTRFLPFYREFINLLLTEKAIGTPKLLKVDFGFLNNWSNDRRLLNPELNGGTLLDNADYNVFLTQDVFREFPSEIFAQATIAETGVEDACSIILKYPSGGLAQLYSSFRCKTKQEAIVYGENGYIQLREFWHGSQIVINLDNNIETLDFPHKINGFEYEIEAVEESIKQGKIENELMPHSASLEVAEIIERVSMMIRNKK